MEFYVFQKEFVNNFNKTINRLLVQNKISTLSNDLCCAYVNTDDINFSRMIGMLMQHERTHVFDLVLCISSKEYLERMAKSSNVFHEMYNEFVIDKDIPPEYIRHLFHDLTRNNFNHNELLTLNDAYYLNVYLYLFDNLSKSLYENGGLSSVAEDYLNFGFSMSTRFHTIQFMQNNPNEAYYSEFKKIKYSIYLESKQDLVTNSGRSIYEFYSKLVECTPTIANKIFKYIKIELMNYILNGKIDENETVTYAVLNEYLKCVGIMVNIDESEETIDE